MSVECGTNVNALHVIGSIALVRRFYAESSSRAPMGPSGFGTFSVGSMIPWVHLDTAPGPLHPRVARHSAAPEGKRKIVQGTSFREASVSFGEPSRGGLGKPNERSE